MTTVMDMNGNVVMDTEKVVNQEKVMRIAELKGILQSSIDQGMPFVVIKINRKFFMIDPDIQTALRTERSIDYLVSNWDEKKCLPLVGIPHFEEGVISIADGWGRVTASKIVDPVKYESMYVMVILTAPADPEERKKFEAKLFVTQNDQVAKLTPLQKHGARLVLGDPAALAIEAMKAKYEFEIDETQGNRVGGVIGSYPQFYSIGQKCGVEALDWILSICKGAGFDRKANGYAKYIMKAFSDLWKLYPNDRDLAKELMSEYLRDWDPKRFKAFAMQKYPMLFETTAVSLYTEDVFVMLSGKKQTRELDGSRVKAKKNTKKGGKKKTA